MHYNFLITIKSQIASTKFQKISMTKNRNSKRTVLVIEYCNLEYVCNLVLIICDFIIGSTA